MGFETDIVFKNIYVIDYKKEPYLCDLLIQDGKILDLVEKYKGFSRLCYEAKEEFCFPGVVDAQVHFREPGNEHKEDLTTGSLAALNSGVTSFFEMPNTKPPTSNIEAWQYKMKRASEGCSSNYTFFFGATPDNYPLYPDLDETLIPAIKVFMGSSTGNLLVSKIEDLQKIMQYSPIPVAVHAEDEDRINQRMAEYPNADHAKYHPVIRDGIAAKIAVENAINLSREIGCRLHVLHMGAKEELVLLSKDDPWVSTECTPHHLLLNDEAYQKHQNFAKCNPPIRYEEDRQALWNALMDGRIDFIATDHAPHTVQEKSQPYQKAPAGLNIVECLLPLSWALVQDQKISRDQFFKYLIKGPVDIYGVENKGQIKPGMDADVFLLDPAAKMNLNLEAMQSKTKDSCIFGGQSMAKWPDYVLVNGKPGKWEGKINSKKFGQPIRFKKNRGKHPISRNF